MARQTRSSGRTKSGASTSTTPSSVVSPVFSTKTSVQSTTPDTSDVDTNTPGKSKGRATRSVTVGVKRKRASSPGPSEVATEPVTPQRRKRQGPQAYVEIPLRASRSLALKVRTFAPNTMYTSLIKFRVNPVQRQPLFPRRRSLTPKMTSLNTTSRPRSTTIQMTVGPSSKYMTTTNLLRTVKMTTILPRTPSCGLSLRPSQRRVSTPTKL